MRSLLAALTLFCVCPWLSGCFIVPFVDDGSNRDVDAGMRKLNVERQERMQEGGSLSAEEYDAVNRRMGGGTLGRPATIEELEARVQADKEKGGR